jgi:hypothetical protein
MKRTKTPLPALAVIKLMRPDAERNLGSSHYRTSGTVLSFLIEELAGALLPSEASFGCCSLQDKASRPLTRASKSSRANVMLHVMAFMNGPVA